MSTEYTETRGAQAFKALEEEMDALHSTATKRVTLDLQDAALRAIALSAFLEPFRERFAALPDDAFDMRHLDGLKPLAWATWYAKQEGIRAKDANSKARLPEPLVESAAALKTVMLRVVDYNLTDPDSLVEISGIRSGSGYVDLANDLNRLANLYENNSAPLSVDKRFYQTSDMDKAREIADAIIDELSIDRSEKAWNKHQSKIWTLLQRSYEETRFTAEWLLRHDDIDPSNLPSLHASTRRSHTVPGNEIFDED